MLVLVELAHLLQEKVLGCWGLGLNEELEQTLVEHSSPVPCAAMCSVEVVGLPCESSKPYSASIESLVVQAWQVEVQAR